MRSSAASQSRCRSELAARVSPRKLVVYSFNFNILKRKEKERKEKEGEKKERGILKKKKKRQDFSFSTLCVSFIHLLVDKSSQSDVDGIAILRHKGTRHEAMHAHLAADCMLIYAAAVAGH